MIEAPNPDPRSRPKRLGLPYHRWGDGRRSTDQDEEPVRSVTGTAEWCRRPRSGV